MSKSTQSIYSEPRIIVHGDRESRVRTKCWLTMKNVVCLHKFAMILLLKSVMMLGIGTPIPCEPPKP